MARLPPPEIPKWERPKKTPDVLAEWIVRAVAEHPRMRNGELGPLLGIQPRQVQAARKELQRRENNQ